MAIIIVSTFMLIWVLAATNSQSWMNEAEASGSNRFIVWQDDTAGNNEILLKRSVNNGGTWGSAVNLSTNTGDSYNPEIVVSGSNVYVVWTQDNAAGTISDIYFRKSGNDGGAWGPKVKISTSGTNSGPAYVAASGSNVYVAWVDGGNNDVHLKRSTDSGNKWKSIVNISNNPGRSSSVQLAVSGSHVFLVWTQDNSDGSLSDIMLRRSADNGASWGPKLKISASGTNLNSVPQIAVSASNVYVTWDDAGTGNIYIKRSADNGATWKPIKNLSNNVGNSDSAQIAVQGSNAYVVWDNLGDSGAEEFLTSIEFRRSTDNGATWKPISHLITISAESSGVFWPEIAASGSKVYLTYLYDTPFYMDLYFQKSSNNGASWTSSVSLTNESENGIENLLPQITFTGSTVYVVWGGNDDAFKPDVFLRRSTDSGTTLGPIVNLSKNTGESVRPQMAT